ncbi:hypothetical protein B0H13DRAFT_2358735 [Mycena leptocephala]|nr:hypothetical protein B0H13DRAFT_2358735 [Mycena leptocephala]
MAQSAVTLWQFGRPRVAAGLVTLPLQPLGTASDGSETTYLYQVLSPTVIITTDQGGFATTTVPATVSRTIVASASGWVEHFGTTEAIECDLINSGFGQCLNINTASITVNSGLPTPLVFPISTSTPVVSRSSTPVVSLLPTTTHVMATPTSSPTNIKFNPEEHRLEPL